MADSKKEQVLKALQAALQSEAPTGVTIERNETVPTRVPSAGWVCLRDGDPGDPETLLSPPTYIYQHLAEVDVVVDRAGAGARDALFDQVTQALGLGIAADRTLGGLCDYVLGEAPAPFELEFDGAENMKAATIVVMLEYATSDPLA